jgi:ATP-binding cassette subfamily B protein
MLKGRTVLLISHRFSTVRSADRIFVLDRGRLIEAGTHDDLIATAACKQISTASGLSAGSGSKAGRGGCCRSARRLGADGLSVAGALECGQADDDSPSTSVTVANRTDPAVEALVETARAVPVDQHPASPQN